MENETFYLNYYECNNCGETWTDVWDCMCNDRCPTCEVEIEPTSSSVLEGGKYNE